AAVCALLTHAGGPCSQAQAAIMIFTDRPTWAAAAAPVNGGENFNGFASDTTFQNTSVPISNGSVSGQPGSNGAQTNKIDALPFGFPGNYPIHRTTHPPGDLPTRH